MEGWRDALENLRERKIEREKREKDREKRGREGGRERKEEKRKKGGLKEGKKERVVAYACTKCLSEKRRRERKGLFLLL